MIPLYGFLQGDTLGLLILARPEMTLAQLALQLRAAARVRVEPGEPSEALRVVVASVELEPSLTVAEANLTPLERFDVRVTHERPQPGAMHGLYSRDESD